MKRTKIETTAINLAAMERTVQHFTVAALNDLGRIQTLLEDLIAATPGQTLEDQCRILELAEQVKDRLKESLQPISDAHGKLSNEILPESFRTRQVVSINVKDYGTFTVSYRTTANKVDWDKAAPWLREIGKGDALKLMCHSQTMSSIVAEHMNNGGTAPPDDVFHTNITRYVARKRS